MKNYALEWKKNINLKQIAYNDFISLPDKSGLYFEKVDGMLGFLVYDNSNLFFQTTTGKTIENIPALLEYKTLFNKLGINEAKIAGELAARKANTLLPFNLTTSIVKTPTKGNNADLIFHYPVDIVSLNGNPYNIKESTNFLSRNIGKIGLPHISLVNYSYGHKDMFRSLYESILEKQGYDGVVVRDYGGKNYKVKFVNTVDLVIIGAGHTEMKAWQSKQVSYLLSSFIDKNGILRSSSKIGTGFTHASRTWFYDYIMKNKLYEKNGDIFVPPKLVVEMKYFRNRITDTPSYEYQNNEFVPKGNMKSITFSHSSFERIRDDKQANLFDVRLEQVPEW